MYTPLFDCQGFKVFQGFIVGVPTSYSKEKKEIDGYLFACAGCSTRSAAVV